MNAEQSRLLALETQAAEKPAEKVRLFRVVRKAVKYAFGQPKNALKTCLNKPGKNTAALCANGGFGDLLRANAMLAQFYKEFPQYTFDVYVHNPELGKFLFGALPNVRALHYEQFFYLFYRRYAFALHTMQLTRVWGKKLPDELAKNRLKAKPLIEDYQAHGEHAWHRVTRLAEERHWDFMDLLCLTAGLKQADDKTARLTVTRENPMKGKKYFTFSTSSNIRDGIHTAATKCWPQEYWRKLIALIAKAYPGLQAVQLGERNAAPIPGADSNYLGHTDLQTACAILQEAKLHIDCDCGLIHFARAVHTPCVALFGPTPAVFVGYKENLNLSAPYCGNCWHVTDDWNKKCPLGFSYAKCMQTLTPQAVFETIQTLLKR